MNILDKKHNDWPWPFKWVPRRWTAVLWGPPKMKWGNQKKRRKTVEMTYWSPKPIGEPNSWQISTYPYAPGRWKRIPIYFAWSGSVDKKGEFRHYRIGLRYDDIDGYATWSIATRKYPKDGERDTSA